MDVCKSRWLVIALAFACATACGATDPGSDATYSEQDLSGTRSVRATHSGKCMDVSGVSKADGAQVQQWTCTGSANQAWQFKDMGSGRHQLISANSGKCLDVASASSADGAKVQQWSCHGGSNQLWTLERSGSGYAIRSVNSGKCLDVAEVSTANGAAYHQWACWGGANQTFTLSGDDDGGNNDSNGSDCPANDPLRTGSSKYDAYDCELLSLAKQYSHPDPMMLKSQVALESDFQPFAVSPDSPCGIRAGWTDAESKSFGLTQVTPACSEGSAMLLPNGHPNMTRDTNSPLWQTSVFNPLLNLQQGVKTNAEFRAEVKRRFSGCTETQYTIMGAGAYNSGSSAVFGCGQLNARAQNYINAVMSRYDNFARQAGYPNPYH